MVVALQLLGCGAESGCPPVDFIRDRHDWLIVQTDLGRGDAMEVSQHAGSIEVSGSILRSGGVVAGPFRIQERRIQERFDTFAGYLLHRDERWHVQRCARVGEPHCGGAHTWYPVLGAHHGALAEHVTIAHGREAGRGGFEDDVPCAVLRGGLSDICQTRQSPGQRVQVSPESPGTRCCPAWFARPVRSARRVGVCGVAVISGVLTRLGERAHGQESESSSEKSAS